MIEILPGFVRNNLADWITTLLLVALLYMLVRPDSVAADFVSAFTGAMTALVQYATTGGQGSDEGD